MRIDLTENRPEEEDVFPDEANDGLEMIDDEDVDDKGGSDFYDYDYERDD